MQARKNQALALIPGILEVVKDCDFPNIDKKFFANFRIKFVRGETMKGGVARDGNPTVWISTHIRYFKPDVFFADVAKQTWKTKSNWQRARDVMNRTGIPYHPEYARIDRDPEIGGIHTADQRLHLLCALVHEVAHAVHWYQYVNSTTFVRPRPHGPEWQAIYRKLRNVLVNPYLANAKRPVSVEDVLEVVEVKRAALVKEPTRKQPKVLYKRPKAGTKGALVWEAADHLKDRALVLEHCLTLGFNRNMISAQYNAWRNWQKYVG